LTDSEHWKRVRRVFAGARRLPDHERAAYLDVACGGDADLLEEVRALLAASTRPDSEIDEIVSDAARAAVGPDATGRLDARVGSYRLVRVIGTGGMGSVYLADRTDEQFSHRVAIKLLHPHRRSTDLIARFRSERQVLANLNHPNIARLLDGGETADGIPYVVMEYVDGVPIDQFCDQRRLPLADRIRLFQKVCAAVDYAHRNLVVHRDIKPSNILVNAAGEPKLLDFGIAKILDASALQHTLAVTREGMRALTPEYASPEQIRGEAISTATDIYSLGVLLYRLLCGRMPYRPRSDLPVELARAILEDVPSRPSTALTTLPGAGADPDLTPTGDAISAARSTSLPRLRARLRGDLDNIVLMTLRKEPERRYASGRELSEDLDRYLGHLAVSARPDTFLYRTGKFLRRHAVGVAVAAAVAALLTAAAVQVVHQRDRAAIAAAQSDRVVQFMGDLFGAATPLVAQGEVLTAADLLQAGVREIDGLNDQPAVQARLYDMMGESYNWIGDFEGAIPLLESALALRTGRLAPDPAALGDTLTDLAESHRLLGNLDKAERFQTEANRNLLAAYGEEHEKVAYAMGRLGDIYRMQQRPDAAVALLGEALELVERLGIQQSPTGLDVLGNYGVALEDADRLEGAVRVQAEAVDLSKTIDGPRHPNTIIRIGNLGLTQMRLGRFDLGYANLREAYDLTREIWAGDPRQRARSVRFMEAALRDLGRFAEAEDYYAEYAGLMTEHFADDRLRAAQALRMRGRWLVDTAGFDQAAAVLGEAMDVLGSMGEEAAGEAARVQLLLAEAELGRGRNGEAEAIARRGLAGRGLPGAGTEQGLRRTLGLSLSRQGRLDEGGEVLTAALSRREEQLGRSNVSLLNYLRAASEHARRAGDPEAALGLARRAHDIGRTITPAGNWLAALASGNYGLALRAAGRTAEARTILDRAATDLEAVFGPEDPRVRALRFPGGAK
jgi:serine/threonine-protein kinase